MELIIGRHLVLRYTFKVATPCVHFVSVNGKTYWIGCLLTYLRKPVFANIEHLRITDTVLYVALARPILVTTITITLLYYYRKSIFAAVLRSE